MALTPSHFRNAVEGVACAQTSVPLRKAITKCCVYLRKFIVLSAVVVLGVSLSQRKNSKNCDGSEEERARSLVRKQKRRQSVNGATEYKRAAAPSEANKAHGHL